VALLSGKICFSLAAACLVAAVVARGAAAQHITIDSSFGTARTLAGPNYAITANLGKQVGSSLFQSFGIFGLATKESATFSGPAAISNVIGRVTGGNPSAIDGNIKSTITGANLYLINPSGIVFGPNATVNVSGSFHASTADYLKMSDGARFQATNPNGSTLSAAPPAAFGFMTAKPAAITVNGSTLGPLPGTIGLVGGPVSIAGGTLKAPAGTIHVASVAGIGEVPVDPRNTAALTVTSFGPVAIKGGSTLDVSNPGGLGAGGSVFIRSGTLTIDASTINADTYGSGAGGQLILRGDRQVALSDGADVHAIAYGSGSGAGMIVSTAPTGVISADSGTVQTGSAGPGKAGLLSVSTGRLTLTNGALLGSDAAGNGGGGGISVDVVGLLQIDGSGGPPLAVGVPATGIASLSHASARGQSGNIAISAGSLSILDKGGIASSTDGSANSGNIAVDVAGQLTIDQTSATGIELGDILGIESQSDPGSTGKAGDLTISAGALSITNTGQLGSPTFGAGDGGNLSLDVAGPLKVDGSGSTGAFLTGIAASVQPGSTGDAGRVAVDAGQLSMIDGEILNGAIGAFGTAPASTGNSGNIAVNVAGLLTIDGAGSSSLTGILTATDPGTRGNAGDIVVVAGSLSIADLGTITAFTAGAGAGGSVSVTAEDLSLTNGGAISSDTSGPRAAGNVTITATRNLVLDSTGSANQSEIDTDSYGSGKAGVVTVSGRNITLRGGSYISSDADSSNAADRGNAGTVTVTATDAILIDGTGSVDSNDTSISSDTYDAGMAGSVTVSAPNIEIRGGGDISSENEGGSGNAGGVTVTAQRDLLLDSTGSDNQSEIDTDTYGSGKAGVVTVSGQNITLRGGSYISSDSDSANAADRGNAGTVTVTATDAILIDGTGSVDSNDTSISSDTYDAGMAGSVTVSAPNIEIRGGGDISSDNEGGSGNAGDVTVTAQHILLLDSTGSANQSEIDTDTYGSGRAGVVRVSGQNITLRGGSYISSDSDSANAADRGNAGTVSVTATDTLVVDGAGSVDANDTSISSDTYDAGMAGSVTVSAPSIELRAGGEISSDNVGGSGNAGDVVITAGALGIRTNADIDSSTFGAGKAGSVSVNIQGQLTIDATSANPNSLTGISSEANQGSTGNAGDVSVVAGALSIVNNGDISSGTFAAGSGGRVSVNVAGQLTIDATSANPNFLTGISSQASQGSTGNAGSVAVNSGALSIVDGGAISASTDGLGMGGDVMVNVAGELVMTGIGNSATTGIFARTADPQGGNAGRIAVAADNIMMLGGGVISTSTYGGGNAGEISLNAAAQLAIDGSATPGIVTGIASSANSGTGNAGRISVAAGSLSISGGGEIQSLTFTSGNGGDVIVASAGDVLVNGSGAALPTGILTDARPGSTGQAGAIELSAQNITIAEGGLVSSSTAGAGDNSGFVALPAPAASGNAGSVMVTAPQITIATGGEIASTTGGGGAGGSVDVTAPGALVLDGGEVPGPEIAASATGPQSGPGGDVTVAAGSLTVQGGAQIASSTAGPGKGGDVAVTVAGNVTLSGPGPQVTAQSTGSGDAGSITVSAVRLLINNGAGISTAAQTSTANGGNIALSIGDFLYLVNSQITTSVKGETGNGGNITIDPQFVILDHSSIIAQAVEGHGGNITITAGTFIASADSIVSATSQLGISGMVTINGPLVDLNGTLVVLSSQLRNAVALTRSSCAARANSPQSSLVEAGRGGLPQDPEATLPALYLAGREIDGKPHAAASSGPAEALQTTVHLAMHCGA
jgi:filamentous hemagglutinin family protein